MVQLTTERRRELDDGSGAIGASIKQVLLFVHPLILLGSAFLFQSLNVKKEGEEFLLVARSIAAAGPGQPRMHRILWAIGPICDSQGHRPWYRAPHELFKPQGGALARHRKPRIRCGMHGHCGSVADFRANGRAITGRAPRWGSRGIHGRLIPGAMPLAVSGWAFGPQQTVCPEAG
jgi:hypothetical protein